MAQKFFQSFKYIDWILFISTLPLVGAGLVTMHSFVGTDAFFEKQVISFAIALTAFFIVSSFDFKFLRRTGVVLSLTLLAIFLLVFLFLAGAVFQGAQSWLNFGFFAFQPAEFAKLVLIILLAKYFSRRHVEIKNIRHIIVSGVYAGIFFLLILVQPDFGSALIIGLVWLGMVLVSGIDKKHLAAVFLLAAAGLSFMWVGVFQDYQKDRILSFLRPLEDIQGVGYNAYQSTITVGSGSLWGKGVGYGTQSRLQFLPEYETDFIFAAYAEEWGFIGVLLLFTLFGVVIWRILRIATHGATNFEILYGLGFAILLMSHIVIHVGMNIGLLPVTGITIPFMSFGGTHLLMTYVGLGILMGMRKDLRVYHADAEHDEIPGVI